MSESNIIKIKFKTSYDKEQDLFLFDIDSEQSGTIVSLGLTGRMLLETLLELGKVVKDKQEKAVTITFARENQQ